MSFGGLRKQFAASAAMLALTLAALSSCATLLRKKSAPHAASRVSVLDRATAAARSREVDRVSYTLWFGLDKEHDDFQGRTVIRFELRDGAQRVARELPVDFRDGTIQSLSLNGTTWTPAQIADHYDGHQIRFRLGELRSGSNRIEIAYSHQYSHTGSGLHRFVDPVDQRVYLYTDLEPFNANQVFPCFDQPDLKASYELTVETPEDWVVIANTPERDKTQLDDRVSWQFPPSPSFSTYLFALHAGEYASWKSEADGIPIRLFARRSLAKFVHPRDWFPITKKGLDFYSVQFGYPYPFAKYDQVIVPEFNGGAMENVAAVTFSEDYLPRSRDTDDSARDRDDTILHEMAHMWFGDLVTMRWWNGLWLNESFATWASTWAQGHLASRPVRDAFGMPLGPVPLKPRKPKENGPAWQDFYDGMKRWGYWEDQLVTTHPIEVSVPDTAYAFAHFDGITYGKGAAVLKQLQFLLGEDDFREGLQRYFQRFAYRNTTLADFIGTLSEASGRDLSTWQRAWLQTAGVNTIQAEWSCSGTSVITQFRILQEPSAPGATLRPHKTRIGLYTMRGGKLWVRDSVDVEYSGASTEIPELVGKRCPALVYPNQGDFDFVKVRLDPSTLTAVRSRIDRIQDSFTREMVWNDLWSMVVDGKLAPKSYAGIALSKLDKETDTEVLRRVLTTLNQSEASAESVMKFTPPPQRSAFARRLESFLTRGFRSARHGSDLQLVWYDALLDAPLSRSSQRLLAGWLDGKSVPAGLDMNQARRWEVIRALARLGAKGIEDRIAAETQRDPSDLGAREAIAARASLPDLEQKQAWLSQLVNPVPAQKTAQPASTQPARQYSDSQLEQAMDGFSILGQEEISRKLADQYFEALPVLARTREETYVSRFAEELYPDLCDSEWVTRTEQFLKFHSKPAAKLPITVLKALRVHEQEERRCIRARELGSGSHQVLSSSKTGQ